MPASGLDLLLLLYCRCPFFLMKNHTAMNLDRRPLPPGLNNPFVYASSMSSTLSGEYIGTIDTYINPPPDPVGDDIVLDRPTIVQGLSGKEIDLSNRRRKRSFNGDKVLSPFHTVFGRIIAATLLLLGFLTCSIACAYYVLAIYGVLVY